MWDIIGSLVPTIIATLGVVALLKGYVARAYTALVAQSERAPKWLTRLLALLVAVLYAASTQDQAALPEITDGAVAAIVAGFLAWLQARVGESGGE